MILQALYEYYERKADVGEIAPIGFEWKPIPFLIVINKEGLLKGLKDTREKIEKKLVAKSYLVPKAVGRSGSSSWKKTNLLWDHYGYVLGYPKGDALKDRNKRNKLLLGVETENNLLAEWKKTGKLLTQVTLADWDEFVEALNPELDQKDAKSLLKNVKGLLKGLHDSEKQFCTFKKSLTQLPDDVLQESSVQAIIQFYQRGEFEKVFVLDNWLDCAGVNGANMTFQMEGENRLILASETIASFQKRQALLPDFEDTKKALCLVTGKQDFIERIHAVTPLVGGQATGKLVGFQKKSGFDSYGKEQAFNAPVGKYAQIAYTTALNTLTKSIENRVFLGDTTVVFWSEGQSVVEQAINFVLTKPKDNPDKGVRAVKQIYESVYSGKLGTEERQRFYVLGIAPNAARIFVRYWLTGTVNDFALHIKKHFDDLEIIRDNDAPEFFALNSLLSHAALKYKLGNLAPNIIGQTTEAALRGTPYPHSLLHATIRRIRAEQHVTRVRAAIVKACINRFNRFHNKNEGVVTVSLDKTNNNPAYLLGRLFAVLEKVQWRALGIETIRERYYGAFSSTPVTVYPQLMKLKNHHLAKLESGKNFFENLIGEIVDGLDGSGVIPRQFSLEEQGRFAVGYYHQRQEMKYKGKTTGTNTENSEESVDE